MLETNFKISWAKFQNNLSNGFSKLQQMQEFVDVTLATGGHLVKAHQNIIAVASPYFKEMLKSTPCQHPVIFLPISERMLCFILEYIYMGEVNVPSNEFPLFVEAAKLLHIAGIKDIKIPKIETQTNVTKLSQVEKRKAEDVSINRTSSNKRRHIEAVRMEVNENNSDNNESAEIPEQSSITQNKGNYEMDFEDLITIKNVTKYPVEGSTTVLENHASETFKENRDEIYVSSGNYSSIDKINYETAENPELSTQNNENNFENHILTLQNKPTCPVLDTTIVQKNRIGVSLEANSGENIAFENLVPLQPTCSTVDTITVQKNLLGESSNVNGVVNDAFVGNSSINYKENESTLPTVSIKDNDISAAVGPKTLNEDKDTKATPLYTISNRGALQMVLNRYVYYLHHTSQGNKKRRWRCINYRRNRCSAFVDTTGELVTGRKNPHNHPFQDKEILKMGRRKQFYSSIADVNYQSCPQQQPPQSPNKSNVNETSGHANQFRISIVYDDQSSTNENET